MAAINKVPDDTRQALHLERLGEEFSLWLDDEQTDDSDCWGQDPAAAAERREEERGTNYFGKELQ